MTIGLGQTRNHFRATVAQKTVEDLSMSAVTYEPMGPSTVGTPLLSRADSANGLARA